MTITVINCDDCDDYDDYDDYDDDNYENNDDDNYDDDGAIMTMPKLKVEMRKREQELLARIKAS